MKKNIIIILSILLNFNAELALSSNLIVKRDTSQNKQQVNNTVVNRNPNTTSIDKGKVAANTKKTNPTNPLNEKGLKDSLKILNDSICKLGRIDSTLKAENDILINRNNNLSSELRLLKKRNISGIPDFVFFVLITILLCLAALLFIKNKKKIANVNQFKERKDYYKSEFNRVSQEINSLKAEKNNLSFEIERLKTENQQFRSEIYQSQQKLKDKNDEPQAAPILETKSPETLRGQSLYADAIIDGKFNRVKEQPDEDTIFELQLCLPDNTQANVIIYEPANRRVIANPSFLEGCEKQILGNTAVTLLREGKTSKDSNGKWIITSSLEVKIS